MRCSLLTRLFLCVYAASPWNASVGDVVAGVTHRVAFGFRAAMTF
jgi:hypothetical protein